MKHPAPRLDVRNLTRRIAGRSVVHDVSLSVAPGEVTCLLGPSGCGKSTTLRMIAGAETPDSGEIYMDGKPMVVPGRALSPEKRSAGLLFQDFALFPHLNVFRNVGFGLPRRGRQSAERVREVLKRVNLEDYAHRFPHELSGGEQQRVALARALAPRPKVMLLDEPFSNLDYRLRDSVRDETIAILREEGTAVLMVTHEPHEAMQVADRIALMRSGRIVQYGTPKEVYKDPADKAAAAFFSEVNVIRGRVSGTGIETTLGRLNARRMDDDSEVDVVIRSQHLRVDFDGQAAEGQTATWRRGVVQEARFLGNESMLIVAVDQTRLRVRVPDMAPPAPGTTVMVSLPQDECFVFPKDAVA